MARWCAPAGLTVSRVESGKDPGYGEGVARWAWSVTPGISQSAGWAELKLAGWGASWAARKQREGEWNGGAGRAGLGDKPGFDPLLNRC
jgi:hypothetical protein